MAIFISIGAFIVLAAVISFFGYRYYTRPGRLYEQLGGHAAVLTPLDSTEVKGDVVVRVIEQLGETPLPKYIKRKVEAADKDRFQTIFAKNKGAVSAPTAGLHFTRQLVKRLQLKGVEIGHVTLHIGLGTFRPVDVEDLTKHKMDSENFRVDTDAVKLVNQALDNKNRVCAIGTTAMRALESAVSANNRLKEREGWTDKFIFPPYDFKICNAMITNFQQPESTLLMMGCAFGGYDLVMQAYQTAKKEKYKFLSYGDAMLIL